MVVNKQKLKVRAYERQDRSILIDMFIDNLRHNAEYISHGEIQMGLSRDGFTVVDDAAQKWALYLDRHTQSDDSYVCVCLDDTGSIVGFVIFGIESDHDNRYGVLYDILVMDKGRGLGTELYGYAIDNLRLLDVADVYIESGIKNNLAHLFFEKHGFRHVSNIYRLTLNT